MRSVAPWAFSLVLLFSSSALIAQSNPAAQTTDGHAQLSALLDREWEWEMESSPEYATDLGDNRFNDRLSDHSAEFALKQVDQARTFLKDFESVPEKRLTGQDVLNRQLMIRRLQMEIEGSRFEPWEMPVNQMNGPHLFFPELPIITPFHNAKDYENYISRLHQMPRVFDQVTANMRAGIKDHLMPPRYLLEKVAGQAKSISEKTGESSPLAKPLQSFPAGITAEDQARLKKEMLAAIDNEVLPAYAKFAEFVRTEYAPHGRTEPGIWALPDGAERYAFDIRRSTTTNMTAEQIHELGLKQVAETEAQMLAVAQHFGYKDLKSFHKHIAADRDLYAKSGQQLLDLYKGYADGMEPELPKLFGRLPKNKLQVIPMEASRAKDAVPADYSPGAMDGSRPGHINVNESDPTKRLLLNVEAIAYHEGIPGHHLQISIGQELPGIPKFRKNAGYTAFVEGWAFYAERLGKDIGFYKDPYSNYGRLENEMWRDIRLVVDTGVHSQHWSRQQMIDYFHQYTAMDDRNIDTEVDRYIAWPGQALAYKIGQLKILELRAKAQKELGTRFDLKDFHDEVLSNSALPLDVLESQVDQWIAMKMAAKP
jgi:uncharacterized protein (DUF885 family)